MGSVEISEAQGETRPAKPIRMSSDYNQQSGPASHAASSPRESQESLHLPPPPDAISDEYVPIKPMSAKNPAKESLEEERSMPSTPTSSHLPPDSMSASRASLPKKKT